MNGQRRCGIYSYNGLLVVKKNEKLSLATTWIDLEMIILSEIRKRQMPYDIIICGI